MRRAEHHYGLFPLAQRRPWARLDVLPFAIGYLCLILLDHSQHKHAASSAAATSGGSNGGGGWWTNYLADALLPLAMLLHAMLRLACVWNVKTRAKIGFQSCSKTDGGWTHVLVEPPPNSGGGGSDIVEISKSGSDGNDVVTVDFRQIRFRCCLGASGIDEEMDGIWTSTPGSAPVGATATTAGNAAAADKFHTLHFPIDLPLTFYGQWSGHGAADSLSRTENLYGTNSHPIPIPPISALLSHQLLQPFFLFQLLCVMLWSLDEYWYYAIFTLLMLILFEWTVAFNRLKSLQRLRETLRPPMQLWVYRCKAWEAIMSDQLVAGDIVSIGSGTGQPMAGVGRGRRGGAHDHEGGTHMPCDMLLLGGGAVVNEAVLTGESVPQIKEAVEGLIVQTGASNIAGGTIDDSCRLDIEDPSHKRSVLFGGTILVNHTPPSQNTSGEANAIPSPPDGGLVSMVLRTGFDTVQGALLRNMVHSTVSGSGQTDGINTTDTYIFVCLLLLCAFGSSMIVLREGWSDPTRNRFKLILHVIIIVTSVVPPELPMELSLAVTTSISDLVSRCKVYCTEPWRIPMAGKVDVCCFDKVRNLVMSLQMVMIEALILTFSNVDCLPSLSFT